MKIDIVDMNLKSNQEIWKNQCHDGGVYIYSFPGFYMKHNDADVYIFLCDDGKEKHESYEVRIITPFKSNINIDEMFYGEDKDEATGNMVSWINEHIMFLEELVKAL